MHLKKLLRSAKAALLALTVAAGSAMTSVTAFADDSSAEYSPSQLTLAAMEEDYYTIQPADPDLLSFSDYYDKYVNADRPAQSVTIDAAAYKSAEGDFAAGDFTADGETHRNVLLWESSSGSVSYDIEVPETGIYCLDITYCGLSSGSSPVELSMKIDGRLPFDTASRITLGRVWVSEREIYKDSRGNQVRPAQVQKEMWQQKFAGDTDGLFSSPLFFYMEKGSHEVTFSSERAKVAIDSFCFCAPPELPSYSEYASGVNAQVTIESTPDRIFRIEGENAAYKSDSTLYPTYDNTNYNVSPSDPRKVVYNTIGSGSWKKALQSVTWKISREDVVQNRHKVPSGSDARPLLQQTALYRRKSPLLRDGQSEVPL